MFNNCGESMETILIDDSFNFINLTDICRCTKIENMAACTLCRVSRKSINNFIVRIFPPGSKNQGVCLKVRGDKMMLSKIPEMERITDIQNISWEGDLQILIDKLIYYLQSPETVN